MSAFRKEYSSRINHNTAAIANNVNTSLVGSYADLLLAAEQRTEAPWPFTIDDSKTFKSFYIATASLSQPSRKKPIKSKQQPAHLSHSLIRNGCLQQQTAFIHSNSLTGVQKGSRYFVNCKNLLTAIQQHFHMFKTFAAPKLYQPAMSAYVKQQQRKIMTFTAPSPFLSGYGIFARNNTTTKLGMMSHYGPVYARNFSTTTVRSSFMANLFQNNAAASQQSSIFGHVTSRIFSPVVNPKKYMTQKDGDTINEDARVRPRSGHLGKESPLIDARANKNQLLNCKIATLPYQLNDNNVPISDNVIRIETDGNHSIAVEHAPTCHSESIFIHKQTFSEFGRSNEVLILDDGINPSMKRATQELNERPQLRAKKGAIRNVQRMSLATSTHDEQEEFKENLDSLTPKNSSCVTSSHFFYISINLDPLQFYHGDNSSLAVDIDASSLDTKYQQWHTQRLIPSFIDSIESMAYRYQVHVSYVLQLLDKLSQLASFSSFDNTNGRVREGEYYHQFRIIRQNGGKELRIYFPTEPLKDQQQSFSSKKDVIDYLCSVNAINMVTYEKLKYFTVVAEECQFMKRFEEQPRDLNHCFSTKAPALESDTLVGPEYFKQLQMFLDHTDYLIEASPAFKSSVSIS
ncbi:hypothetical protein BDF20DRAFT_909251 [Mycotypha africana]|uniref:uncharacterized protein n=1 Tax=Mycotypha africana TaxID=64632 RepID=UPI0022FFCBF0|nr:uncharacterized protein BDF20DRAFT_909251 [Mycotypha africana]KAI8991476.1 hypothetical protein BDF20DRAFT_909251 [Mycotypha africana]